MHVIHVYYLGLIVEITHVKYPKSKNSFCKNKKNQILHI